MGFGVWGLGFGVWGLGFGVWGLGFGVWGLGFGVWGLEFGVWGLGFGVWGLGVPGLGSKGSGFRTLSPRSLPYAVRKAFCLQMLGTVFWGSGFLWRAGGWGGIYEPYTDDLFVEVHGISRTLKPEVAPTADSVRSPTVAAFFSLTVNSLPSFLSGSE